MGVFSRNWHPSDNELIVHQNGPAAGPFSSWGISLHVLTCRPCRDRLRAVPHRAGLQVEGDLEARIEAVRRRLLADIGESRKPLPPSALAREVVRDLLGEEYASNLNESNWLTLERQLGVLLGYRSTIMLRRKFREQSCQPQP
ncbi:MAG: hypothetical protein JNL98_25385 [Bryobacterales bacterium]|nr:hypothetical protein [Bryobacterales bacterium]